MQNPTAVPVQ